MGKKKTKEKNKKSKMKWKWWQILLIVVAFFIVCSITFMVLQKDIFFYPVFDKESHNYLLTQDSFEEVEIKIVDEDSVASSINMNVSYLRGWIKYNNPRNEKSPLLIFFYGNASNAAGVMRAFEEEGKFKTTFKGYNVMCIDYPGYGQSTGEPSDKTLFDAGIKTYDYAKMQDYVDNNNIVVMGYSIGTGVATYVASKENPKGLVLVAPYDKGLSLYNGVINSFYGPMKSYARYKFNSSKEAGKILCDGLIITSRDDEVINYQLSLNLANDFTIEPEVMVVDGVTHNQYFYKGNILSKIREYLETKLPEETIEEPEEESKAKARPIKKPKVVY